MYPVRIQGERPYYSNLLNQVRDLSLAESITSTDLALDENYKLELTDKSGINIVLANGMRARFLPSSSLYGAQNSSTKVTLCSDSRSCAFPKIDFSGIFPPCTNILQSDCISRFGYLLDSGEIEDFIPQGQVDTQFASRAMDFGNKSPVQTYEANPKLGITAGSVLYVWKSKNFKHKFGQLFIPQIIYSNQNISNSKYPGAFNQGFDISAVPVRLVKAERITTYEGIMQRNYNLIPSSYLLAPRYVLEFRTSMPWVGWAKSTIADLRISQKRIGTDYVYSIQGAPLRTQIVQKNLKISDVETPILRNIIFPGSSLGKQCPKGIENCTINITNMKIAYKGIFSNLSLLESKISKVANAYPYKWSIGNIFGYNYYSQMGILGDSKMTKCLASYKNILAGISSTNSLVTSDGPPSWNSKNSTLDYQLFSLAQDKSGAEFKGTYSLRIANEVATCLWGIRPAASDFKIEVTNSDGSTQLVTTNTIVDGTNLNIQVSGFHFSSPTMRVKMLKK